MNIILNVSICVFVILGIIFIYKAYKPIVKRIMRIDKDNGKQDSTVILENMANEKDVKKISKGFITLLKSSYVLIHIMINEGNKYNDKVQSHSFCSSLTTDVMNSLNSLEGRYE